MLKCLLFTTLFLSISASAQVASFSVDDRVIYTPDNSYGTVRKMSKTEFCVDFDEPRFDGETRRCTLSALKFKATKLSKDEVLKMLMANDPFTMSQRVEFKLDGAVGSVMSFDRDDESACVLFDVPHPYSRNECEVQYSFLKPSDSVLPIYHYKVGMRVKSSSLESQGLIYSVDPFAKTICVNFEARRKKKWFAHCLEGNSDIELVNPSPLHGKRVEHPKYSLGTVLTSELGDTLVCVKFDLPYEKQQKVNCEIQVKDLVLSDKPSPVPLMRIGAPISYIYDGSLGSVTAVDFLKNQVCVRFEKVRPDGAIDRCQISLSDVKLVD